MWDLGLARRSHSQYVIPLERWPCSGVPTGLSETPGGGQHWLVSTWNRIWTIDGLSWGHRSAHTALNFSQFGPAPLSQSALRQMLSCKSYTSC